MENLAKKIITKILNKNTILEEEEVRNKEYKQLIEETENLYKELLLNDYPSHSGKRINLMSKLMGTQVSESIYIIYYLNKILKLEGDVCEFGVAQGCTSALMANEIKKTNKKIYLFDSFEGLPQPSKEDQLKDDIFNLGSIDAYKGTMNCKVNMVIERLESISFPHNRIKIIPGFIEKTIKTKNLPKKVCFAYIDFDFYEPTLIALDFLNKNLIKKGFIIVDDYDFFSTGVKKAVEKFLVKHKDRYKVFLPVKAAGHFCIIEKLF